MVAAAVILKKNIDGLKDSKKLNQNQRKKFSKIIIENSYFAYGSASEKEIDQTNILNATLLAMKRAILNLPIKPSKIFVDGIQKPDVEYEMESVIKGDSLIKQISAASIIAKVRRDNLMQMLDKEYPEYQFSKNKGYGTKSHFEALKTYGYCPIHRKTFKGVL